MSAIFKEMNEKTKDLDGAEARKVRAEFFAREDYRTLSKKRSELSKEQGTLRPRAKRTSGVWLYRQHTAEPAAPVGDDER